MELPRCVLLARLVDFLEERFDINAFERPGAGTNRRDRFLRVVVRPRVFRHLWRVFLPDDAIAGAGGFQNDWLPVRVRLGEEAGKLVLGIQSVVEGLCIHRSLLRAGAIVPHLALDSGGRVAYNRGNW